jgi:hypothetical protein
MAAALFACPRSPERARLANGFFLESNRAGAAWGTLHAVAQLANIDFQLREGAAESVAVHAQLACGAALIALVFLEHSQDKALLKLTNSLGVQNVALVHLHDERFELIFHSLSLSLATRQRQNFNLLPGGWRQHSWIGDVRMTNQIEPLIKLYP